MEKVLNFLNGNNELLLAYGTTNAGKTYTIHGNFYLKNNNKSYLLST